MKVPFCINYREAAALGEEFLAGLADATGLFVLPSLFIPFLIIRFTFPFLPLDPAVTMGTVFTVAFHWLRKSSVFPFASLSPFPVWTGSCAVRGRAAGTGAIRAGLSIVAEGFSCLFLHRPSWCVDAVWLRDRKEGDAAPGSCAITFLLPFALSNKIVLSSGRWSGHRKLQTIVILHLHELSFVGFFVP